jgi:hypothetical protein
MEKSMELKQLVEQLKKKGLECGLYYSKGGPSGVKLSKAAAEKLFEILNKK